MAEGAETRWQAPLKIPAIEVVDLASATSGEVIQGTLLEAAGEKRDASGAESDSEANSQWEDSQWSLYEDAILGEEDDGPIHGSKHFQITCPRQTTNIDIGEGSCTLEEAALYRKRLRIVGGDRFLDETVNAGVISAKKLCTAFGIRPPLFLEDAPDEAFHSILNLGICRELSRRVKLSEYNTVDDAVSLLKKSRNIIVLTGAGVGSLDKQSWLSLTVHTDIYKPRYTRLPIKGDRSLLSTATSGPQ